MKRNKWFVGLLACAAALFVTACDDDDYDYDSNGVYVDTPVLSETSLTSASLSCKFSVDKDVRYTAAGFCYSTSSTPTIYDNTSAGDVDENLMTGTLTNLSSYTTYYVRAYVCVYQGDVTYSDEVSFTTTLNEELAAYVAPTYEDYYVDIADWDNRSSWNLANVHDPSVVLADDGYYYMYQTDASYGNAHVGHGHFHARRSTNLIDWEYLGATMDALPDWVVPKLNEIRAEMGLGEYSYTTDETEFGYWAPCVRKVNSSLYRMYYSIVVPGYLADGDTDGSTSWGERAFIGLMETSDPSSNNWTDKGYVITNASDKGLDIYVPNTDYTNCYYKWNAIDPSYIITDDGEHWLIYGSWNSGIAAVQLNSSTGLPAEELGNPWGDSDEEIAAYGSLIATRQMGNRWQGSEGPEIVYRNGYYYLFLAYDELSVAYNTRVVRSTSLTGPYSGIDGTDVTVAGGEAYPVVTHPYKFNDSDGWVGISHCAVFDDGNDNWYFASQGRFPSGANGNDYSNALMMGQIRRIIWTEDNWPLVLPERYGAVPEVAIETAELIGTWENIDLSYSYGNQKTSESMVLADDYTVTSGSLSGSEWSFDEESQILTVGGIDLYVARETDWEASPRTYTIVYAGYNGSTTYWGKKSK